MKSLPKLAIISPFYNEEEIIQSSIETLINLLNNLIEQGEISSDSFICLIDDGSIDNSYSLAKFVKSEQKRLKIMKLSRNFGHQNAILAGLFNNEAEIYITIDIDLQDDLNVILQMINKYKEGAHIVYGVKKNRNADNFFKKISAECYYKLMKFMGANLVFNHADFRLLSSQVIENLKKFDEKNLFLRGIIPLLGFSSTPIYYDIKERQAGQSKYNLQKMIKLALNGITSFSTVPLELITMTGFIIFALSIVYVIYSIYQKIMGNVVPGWTSIIMMVSFIGGLQLLALGIIGEYIAKIYTETKRRPTYIIEEVAE